MVIKSIPINNKTNLSPETQTEQIKNLLQIAIREKAEYPKRDRDMVNLMEDMHRGNYGQTIHRSNASETSQAPHMMSSLR